VRDPEATRKRIIDSASILFNTQGYKATSISDITTAAGLTKGAIYKHFKDKAQLEEECLIRMSSTIAYQVGQKIKSAPDTRSKMEAIFDYFSKYTHTPPFEGGCPLLNASIEMDDTNYKLKKVVAKATLHLQDGIKTIIQNGIYRKQIDPNIDIEKYTCLVYSAIEGGIMIMKVTDSPDQLLNVIDYLKMDLEKYLL